MNQIIIWREIQSLHIQKLIQEEEKKTIQLIKMIEINLQESLIFPVEVQILFYPILILKKLRMIELSIIQKLMKLELINLTGHIGEIVM